MNKLAVLLRTTLTCIILLAGVILRGQTPTLSGSGTEASPYLITSTADWNIFAQAVTDGNDYNGLFLKLTGDITITVNGTGSSDKIAGVYNGDNDCKPFSGTFDGDWHTITFNVGTDAVPYVPGQYSSTIPYPSAPFRVIDGATIKNLHVTGKIVSTRKYNSGLVGFSYSKKYSRTNYINNCTSSIEIDCKNITAQNSDCSSAGFVAENKKAGTTNSELELENCIFDGNIHDTRTPSKAAIKGAGFVTYTNNDAGHNIKFTNCLMAGTLDLKNDYKTFSRTTAKVTYSGICLYTYDYGGIPANNNNCVQASTTWDGVHKKYTVRETDYYVPVKVTPELRDMFYTAPIEVSLSYYGKTLVEDTDYTIHIEKKIDDTYETVTEIDGSAGANYKVTLASKAESDFEGSKVYTFKFLTDAERWQILVDAIKNTPNEGTITLLNDHVADLSIGDDALTIPAGKALTINLNGHTINRNLSEAVTYGQVIRIASGANLTIIGPGTITGGYNLGSAGDIDGGGIYNAGTLTLNNVTVTGNKCLKQNGEDATGRGGGIYSGPKSSFTMTDGNISYNEAKGGGGGIYIYGSEFASLTNAHLTNVRIEGNISESKGGGIRVENCNNTVVDNCYIFLNSVTDDKASQGGGIHMGEGNLTLNSCDIVSNMSRLQGCGFYAIAGITIANNCRIYYNMPQNGSPQNSGGGIYLHAGSFTLNGGSVDGNYCDAKAGGIYVNTGAKLKLTGNVQITDNTCGSMFSPDPEDIYLADHTKNGVIEILSGFDGVNSSIGVAKNYSTGFVGVFTKDLIDNGGAASWNCFTSTESSFTIGPSSDGKEAQFSMPVEWGKWGAGDVSVTGEEPFDYEIKVPVTIIGSGETVSVNSISFSGTGCLIVESGAILNAPTITNDDPIRLVIEDGGQVITSNSDDVDATVNKSIHWANDNNQDYWYLISSAINAPSIANNTNLISVDGNGYVSYDLYRFNEAVELQWENYRNVEHAEDFTTMQNGRGYLYRSGMDKTITIKGHLNVGTEVGETGVKVVEYPMSCSGSDELNGFNLIGNPYSHNITKGNSNSHILNGDLLEANYYVLNAEGTQFVLAEDGNTIAPLTGIIVQARQTGDLAITNILPTPDPEPAKSGEFEKKDKDKNIWFTLSNSEFEDKTCVKFKRGHGLNKIAHPNEDAPMLYVNHNGEDFASVDMNPEEKAFNLNFEAKTTSWYTLKMDANGEFDYIHIIDKIAKRDIDMLGDGEYSFVGTPSDDKDRFVVRLSETSGNDDDETFAYQNGNEIIVSGEGELQIFDVMGRLVAAQYINGVGTWRAASTQTGVYILRLNGKTQKIVVK